MGHLRLNCTLFCILAVAVIASGCTLESSGATIDPTEMSAPPETNLEATLQAPAKLPAGDSVEVAFTLSNHSDSGLYVLTWYTPLEGIAGEIFRVERDGQPIPYNGPLVMRGNPTADAYVFLDPGASVSTTVDLAAVGETGSPIYDFSEPGKYTITFVAPRISHVARSEREMATSVDDLGPLEMPSNPITVEITSPPRSLEESEAPEADPAAGLIYSTGGELWAVDGDGSVVPLIDQLDASEPDLQISSDGRWAVFSSGFGTEGSSDIWLIDLETGARHNLTNTPDRDEVNPVWWPGRPDVIVFGSGVGMEIMGGGYPTITGIDGSGYQVLDAEEGGPRAPSPDGRMIAYGGYDNVGSIYHWDAGPEPFDPSRYGISVEKLYQPAWHPDSRHLAWKVGGDLTGEGRFQIGIAIFDLQAGTAELLHPYEPIGGTFPHYLAWSPGGEWLAFVTYQEPPAQGRLPNLWVVRWRDGEEVYVGAGVDPTWSPDGRHLAFTAVEEDRAAIAIAEVGTWQTRQLDLPHEVESLRSWIRPRSLTK